MFGHGAPGGHVEVGDGLLGGAGGLVGPAAVLGDREADDAPPAVDAAQLGVTGEVAGDGEGAHLVWCPFRVWWLMSPQVPARRRRGQATSVPRERNP